MKRKNPRRSSRGEKKRMKGKLARHLTVQKPGQISFVALHQQSSSSISLGLADSSRFRSLLESEAEAAELQLPLSSPLYFDIHANADDKDFILSQDFFCTHDNLSPTAWIATRKHPLSQVTRETKNCQKQNGKAGLTDGNLPIYLLRLRAIESHPDKLWDHISDAVLDACLAPDPDSKVACETCTKTNMVKWEKAQA